MEVEVVELLEEVVVVGVEEVGGNTCMIAGDMYGLNIMLDKLPLKAAAAMSCWW